MAVLVWVGIAMSLGALPPSGHTSPAEAALETADTIRVDIHRLEWGFGEEILLRQVLRDVGYPSGRVVFRTVPAEKRLEGIINGDADIAIGMITVTADREKQVDFTVPHSSSPMGVLVARPEESFLVFWGRALWNNAYKLFLALTALALIFETGYRAERAADRRLLRQTRRIDYTWIHRGQAIGWFSTILGGEPFGNPPRSAGGQLCYLVSMAVFVGFVMTAFGALLFDVQRQREAVQPPGIADLRGAKAAVKVSTTGVETAKALGCVPVEFATVEACVAALRRGEANAAVYDRPGLIQYTNDGLEPPLTLLRESIAPQMYAFALPKGSPLREPLSQSLLEVNEANEYLHLAWR